MYISVYTTAQNYNTVLQNKFTKPTSSGTALMLVNPFLKMTNTLRAPQRRADVQQSKAVSPHPRTMTFPNSSGNFVLQEHIPTR